MQGFVAVDAAGTVAIAAGVSDIADDRWHQRRTHERLATALRRWGPEASALAS